jgi:hypothetical protein
MTVELWWFNQVNLPVDTQAVARLVTEPRRGTEP